MVGGGGCMRRNRKGETGFIGCGGVGELSEDTS